MNLGAAILTVAVLMGLKVSVVVMFPLPLVGALLAEQNEVWQERKYLDMDEFAEWAAARAASAESGNVAALGG